MVKSLSAAISARVTRAATVLVFVDAMTPAKSAKLLQLVRSFSCQEKISTCGIQTRVILGSIHPSKC